MLPIADITQRVYPYLEKAGLPVKNVDRAWLERAVDTIRGHLEVLPDAAKFMRLYFEETFEIEAGAQALKADPSFATVVHALKQEFEKLKQAQGDLVSADDFARVQDSVKATTGAKGKNLFMPMRVALTGQLHGPELKLVVPILGTGKSIARIAHVMQSMGV
jgi:glutamyl/glutaminyl-tRNA synthetase